MVHVSIANALIKMHLLFLSLFELFITVSFSFIVDNILDNVLNVLP